MIMIILLTNLYFGIGEEGVIKLFFDDSKKDVNNHKVNEKIGFKDLLAIMIAQFEILAPIVLGIAFIMYLLMLFMTQIWFQY